MHLSEVLQPVPEATTMMPTNPPLVTAPLNAIAQAHPHMDAHMLFDDSSETEYDMKLISDTDIFHT